jgi:hypothetical protein
MGRLLYELSKGHNTFLLFEGDTEEGIAGTLLAEETRKRRRGQRAIGVVYNPE